MNTNHPINQPLYLYYYEFISDSVGGIPSVAMLHALPESNEVRNVYETNVVRHVQDPGFEGAVSKRDTSSGNKRKRPRTKRPTKAAVAAAVASATADGAATGPTGAAAVSAATGSALSQRRRYIFTSPVASTVFVHTLGGVLFVPFATNHHSFALHSVPQDS